MSEIICGGSRFDLIKSHAFWHNKHLDTRLTFDPENIDDTLGHLKDCYEHPTTGLIARRKMLEDGPYYPYHYWKNKIACFNIPKVKASNDSFESRYKKLYPRTGNIRKVLINEERVTFSNVTPKLNIFKKLAYKFKGFIG